MYTNLTKIMLVINIVIITILLDYIISIKTGIETMTKNINGFKINIAIPN
jgi:hypothetical protein